MCIGDRYHVVRLDVGGVAALSERQGDEAAARQMKAACEKSQAVCTSLKKEKKTAAPVSYTHLDVYKRQYIISVRSIALRLIRYCIIINL